MAHKAPRFVLRLNGLVIAHLVLAMFALQLMGQQPEAEPSSRVGASPLFLSPSVLVIPEPLAASVPPVMLGTYEEDKALLQKLLTDKPSIYLTKSAVLDEQELKDHHSIVYKFQNLTIMDAMRQYEGKEYDRYEFLGDAVLGFCIASMLFNRFPGVNLEAAYGGLTRREPLALVSRSFGFYSYFYKPSHLAIRAQQLDVKSLCNTTEALIGALYSDGGFDCARRFIARFWEPMVAHKTLSQIRRESSALSNEDQTYITNRRGVDAGSLINLPGSRAYMDVFMAYRGPDASWDILITPCRSTPPHDCPLIDPAILQSISSPRKRNQYAFLGDYLARFWIAVMVADYYPSFDSGALTEMRDSLWSKPVFDAVSKYVLQDVYVSGTYGNHRPASVPITAIIGALYRDSGFDCARQCIEKIWGPMLVPYESPKGEKIEAHFDNPNARPRRLSTEEAINLPGTPEYNPAHYKVRSSSFERPCEGNQPLGIGPKVAVSRGFLVLNPLIENLSVRPARVVRPEPINRGIEFSNGLVGLGEMFGSEDVAGSNGARTPRSGAVIDENIENRATRNGNGLGGARRPRPNGSNGSGGLSSSSSLPQ